MSFQSSILIASIPFNQQDFPTDSNRPALPSPQRNQADSNRSLPNHFTHAFF
jgi:hypothetical protein